MTTVFLLVNTPETFTGFIPEMARVGALPVVLRSIITAQQAHADRIVVCVDSSFAPQLETELYGTGRAPESLEWYESDGKTDIAALIRHVAAKGDRVVLIRGDRSYHPSLLRKAINWKGPTGALALTTRTALAGIYVLSPPAARSFSFHCTQELQTLEDLHAWMRCNGYLLFEETSADLWQQIAHPDDRPIAERKLDSWLVKPTDGTFARMNRKISIPISRSIIDLPITPNMVTFFTLGVSIAAGAFFALGGYWNTLLGAALSVWASIFDGCDGEVARLKLQASDFGCWLETVCDYLYYVFVFAGMSIGLARSMGKTFAVTWGALLLFGSVTSFLAVGFARHHFSPERPESFLAIWQKKAEKRSSNPLLYVGRNCEFIIRRCFFPYALLVFALLNVIPLVFVVTAFGANIVWCIALYSCFALSARETGSRAPATAVRTMSGTTA